MHCAHFIFVKSHSVLDNGLLADVLVSCWELFNAKGAGLSQQLSAVKVDKFVWSECFLFGMARFSLSKLPLCNVHP